MVLYILLFLASVFNPEVHDFFRSRIFLGATFGMFLLEFLLKRDETQVSKEFLLLMGFLMLAMFVNDSGVTSVLQFLTMMLLITREQSIEWSKRTMTFFILSLFLINLLLVNEAFTDYYSRYISYRSSVHMINPNHYAAILVYISTVVSAWIYTRSQHAKIFLMNGYLIFNAWAIYHLEARAALLSLLVYLFVMNWYLLTFPKNRDLKRKSIELLFALGLLAVLVYPAIMSILYHFLGNDEFFITRGSLFRKAIFSGREKVWTKFFIGITQSFRSFLFGLGSKYEFNVGNVTTNIHHSFLNIYKNNGLIMFLFYVQSVYKQWILKYKNKFTVNDQSFSVLLSLGVFSALVLSAFENTFSTFSYGILYLIYFSGLNISTTKIQSE